MIYVQEKHPEIVFVTREMDPSLIEYLISLPFPKLTLAMISASVATLTNSTEFWKRKIFYDFGHLLNVEDLPESIRKAEYPVWYLYISYRVGKPMIRAEMISSAAECIYISAVTNYMKYLDYFLWITEPLDSLLIERLIENKHIGFLIKVLQSGKCDPSPAYKKLVEANDEKDSELIRLLKRYIKE